MKSGPKAPRNQNSNPNHKITENTVSYIHFLSMTMDKTSMAMDIY